MSLDDVVAVLLFVVALASMVGLIRCCIRDWNAP
jgi:hypothetical protein